jgi:predicted MFS family arabinose efflux permease
MKKIAVVSCLGVIGILTTEFGVIGILPQIAAHYDITIAKAGWLLSLFALVVGIIGPFMSMVSARFNRKAIMCGSLTLFLISGLISAAAPPFWLLLTVRILPTILHSAYFAAALAAVISTSKKDDQHRMMAIALSGINIATVTTVPLTTYISSLFSWQYSFAFQALISGLALVAILLYLPSMPVQHKVNFGDQLKILRKPSVWLSLAMCVLMFAGEFAIYSYFADYMLTIKGTSTNRISLLMFVFGLTGLAGTWLAGRFLGKSIAMTNIAFVVGCTLFIPLALYYSGSSWPFMILIVAAWGLLYAPGVLIATSSISSAAPEALEFANGLTASFANFGIAAGTVTGGYVIVHQGIAQTPWLSVAFGCLAIIMIFIRMGYDQKLRKTSLLRE